MSLHTLYRDECAHEDADYNATVSQDTCAPKRFVISSCQHSAHSSLRSFNSIIMFFQFFKISEEKLATFCCRISLHTSFGFKGVPDSLASHF